MSRCLVLHGVPAHHAPAEREARALKYLEGTVNGTVHSGVVHLVIRALPGLMEPRSKPVTDDTV